VVLGFGRVELKRKDQYERLEQVIESTIHSFHILDLRIYDEQNEVAFSTNEAQVGNAELGGVAVQTAIEKGIKSFELQNSLSIWDVLLAFKLEPGDVVLRTVFPLRAERDLRFRDQPGPLLGCLS
jgi:hypothetical protein